MVFKEISIWKFFFFLFLKKEIIELIPTLETRTYVVILNKSNNFFFNIKIQLLFLSVLLLLKYPKKYLFK